MLHARAFELPGRLRPAMQKAKRLEWITLAYQTSVVIIVYLTAGASQAMKTSWLEDALSLLPPIAFLIASRIYDRPPNEQFPYGYHRIFSIAFLTGALSLFAMGVFLIFDSSMTLFTVEHPTIGSIQIFDNQAWMGWIMIVALVYGAVPAIFLGRKKLPLAKELHNKILFTDADTQKANYMTAIAAIVGVISVGFGLWWADATAAIFISFSILHDGFTQLKISVLDLMDRHPVHTDDHKPDELVAQIESYVRSWPWVQDGKVRLREEGQIYIGEVFVIPHPFADIIPEIDKAVKLLEDFHWKVHDIVITPVPFLPEE